MDEAQMKEMVRARYGSIATGTATSEGSAGPDSSCCSPAASSCCGPATASQSDKALRMGYSATELALVPEGANLGLGCGNPQAIAAMRAGEVVIDLGSGAGFDCFLAAQQVGPTGHVVGVDMTHEMLQKARENAAKIAATNVEFRLGELEHLPIADNSADVVISNCVINLVPDKAQVFREVFRVLKPGGRVAVSDIVNTAPLPADIRADPSFICGCVAGAASIEQIQDWLTETGFADVDITVKSESRELIKTWAPGRGIEDYVVSAIIQARKPLNHR
jgi:arsenite methyltransferase